MDGEPVQGPGGRNRTRKRAGRRARGLHVLDRGGIWYIAGTVRAGGRSIRLRRSLGLAATADTYDAAWNEAQSIERDIRAEATGERTRGDPVAVAAEAYLRRKRKRPVGPSSIRVMQDIVLAFGQRRLNEVGAAEWRRFVDQRQAGNVSATRERFLNVVAAFLHFAGDFHGLTIKIKFDRDKEARNPRRRARRQVEALRPELIARLISAAHITLRAQIAVEWSTGARVSSVLYGVRVCDVILARGRETITFRATKNGDDVSAALHPSAAAILLDYAEWRGHLHDREALFFLTYKGRPYSDNGRGGGGQNKTAWLAAKRRARRTILADAIAASRAARAVGQRQAALATLLAARADMRLLRRVTQHWFRHMLATRMRGDLRAAMEQGGWRDERSILGYISDVPAERRAIVASFEDFGTVPTHQKVDAK